jgi:hypothetical protein
MQMNSRLVAVIVLAACSTAEASEKPYSVSPIAIAVRHGQCETASKLINPDVGSNDRQSAFVAGRLLDEGVCMQADPASAAHFFARAAELGDRNGTLEFAAKVGLGVGAEQDYQRAGELCRAAGVDPKGKLSTYSLGYACTVRGVAGKLLRQTLPTAAFTPAAGAAALVEFTLPTRQIRIVSTPHVTRVDPDIGSLVKHPMVDADKEIDRAWRDALAAAPQPDAARLDNQAVELPLDVDMTLEVPREADRTSERNQHLFRDDLHGTTTGQVLSH